MVTLGVLLGLYLGVIVLGKRVRKAKPMIYVYVALIALAQACWVLFEMLTTSLPKF
jgi:hypothetical protein